ncbi:hypothetical protein CERSUDRAFT_118248 [Gelatoporia subvermispora B]|uniref:Core domain-containing protein n=1 Tax=Ceriporiopsis subvermispora (strain B) TaxID=914234 RepID=M2R4Q2_CERS8|nr:hypothetical protein CERSUDRAFT_118248 [Gelatoporia subvermispora B]
MASSSTSSFLRFSRTHCLSPSSKSYFRSVHSWGVQALGNHPARCIPRIVQVRDTRRTFTTSRAVKAALALHPPGQQTILLSYPSPSSQKHDAAEEDADEPEVDLVPPEEAKIEITDRAAEQLRAIAQRENNPSAALRIIVESGGCHGYQYKMELAKTRQTDDYHFAHPVIQPSNILIDAVSLSLLNGSTVDFATELIGSSFRVLDNPQSKGSGCGCGVSWELKI